MRLFINYLALLFLMLVTGVYWGPWLGLHQSLDTFSLSELIHLSQVLAHNLGSSMGFLLPICIGLLSVSAWLYPHKAMNPKSFYGLLLASLLVIVSLGISVGIELPIVNQIKVWTPTSFPANWEVLRDKWVYFTVIRMLTGLVAFALFSAILLQSDPPKPLAFRQKAFSG